jgi:hypothetical protein
LDLPSEAPNRSLSLAFAADFNDLDMVLHMMRAVRTANRSL